PSTIALLADRLTSQGDTALAAGILQSALQKYPADFWLNHQMAYMLWMTRPPRLDASLRYYGVAMAIRPQSPGAPLTLGVALLRQGAFAEAAIEFKEAIRLKPDYAGAYVDLGVAYEQLKRYDEALQNFRRAAELQADYAEPHECMARVFSAMGNRPEAIAE